MILDKIIEYKRIELEKSKRNLDLTNLIDTIDTVPKPKQFYKTAIENPNVKIIAEIKRASPSKGIINNNFDHVKIAKSYERNGAFALSVLTDNKFFMGKLQFLSDIRKKTDIPIIRKDFTIDPYNIYEARASGADIVLLIVSVLELSSISELLDLTHSLGMDAIVEVHNENELEIAIKAGSNIIGINNRDLKTFEVDISTTVRLAKLIPNEVLIISESGISKADHIKSLSELGVSTFLIGEAFMSHSDPGIELKKLLSDID